MRVLYLSNGAKKTDVIRFILEKVLQDVGAELIALENSDRNDKDYFSELVAAIEKADLIIPEVTGQGANISMEVGAALQSKKPILPIFESGKDSPGSLMLSLQHLSYKGADKAGDVSARLKEAIEAIQANGTRNPEEPPVAPRSLFISYSHEDREYLDRLLIHLKPLERAGLIEMWSDTQIRSGDRWRAEIESALDRANIAILLLSADFMASEFITRNELPPLLKSAEERGTKILPIIVKPCRFLREPTLSQFQSANLPSSPLVLLEHGRQEEILDLIAAEVERYVAI